MHILSIDPGLSGTGWAEWWDGKLTRVGVVPATKTPESGLLADQCEQVADRLKRMLDKPLFMDEVYIEMPQMMTNVKGIAAQAGAVYKLAFLVGYLAREFLPGTVHTVTVAEWKGQLPKDVVQRRIERDLGKRTCEKLNIKSHAWDAVGIGLWAVGRWR
jgi:Holliday junction resolvasome RuvABC endonuclease subunit